MPARAFFLERLTGYDPVTRSWPRSCVTNYAIADWCSSQESNLKLILTKNVLFHLTTRAWPRREESNSHLEFRRLWYFPLYDGEQFPRCRLPATARSLLALQAAGCSHCTMIGTLWQGMSGSNTLDGGIKTRCLPIWLIPNCLVVRAALEAAPSCV
jgi:hypothetical protein